VITIEPRVLPRDPFDFLERNGSPVPLLIGSTSEETSPGDDPSVLIDVETYRNTVRAEFNSYGPGVANRILELYPASEYDSPKYALIAVHTDWYLTAEVQTLSRAAAIGHEQPVWRYLFTHRFENDPGLNAWRAFHTADMFFVFGNLGNILSVQYTPTQTEIDLSNRLMRYWIQFATYGNPNGIGPVEWPRYTGAGEPIFELNEPPKLLMGYHTRQCNFLATLQPQP
jgi:para-nitrobenzyl esterase